MHSGRQQGHRVSPPVAGLVIIPSLRSAEECANLVVSKSCVPLLCPVSFLGSQWLLGLKVGNSKIGDKT